MKLLFQKRIDNSALILFRIFFGVLMAWQSFYYLGNGWIDRNLTGPKFTFSHIGMEWLQPLPGNGMAVYFGIMGVTALFVAIGFYYRLSLTLLTILWGGVYFMQKTVYNNHYYLLLLVCVIMIFLPANAYASFDSRNKEVHNLSMPAWCSWVMMAQVFIVYFFAATAKLYPDWFNGTFTGIVFEKFGIAHGIKILLQPWFHILIAWTGFLFDLLIIPMFFWKRTRVVALLAALAFHSFNAITLTIGIFPFFAMGFVVFFFAPDTIRRLFFWRKPFYDKSSDTQISQQNRSVLLYFFAPYFIIQLLLPVRHWFIKGDVLWTEEGHRLSWRMMLRHRSGTAKFTVVDLTSGEKTAFDLNKLLTKNQIKGMQTHPDMIWQTAQRIREEAQTRGKKVAVYVLAETSVNRRPKHLLIDPDVDLAHAEWNYFSHNDWILTYD